MADEDVVTEDGPFAGLRKEFAPVEFAGDDAANLIRCSAIGSWALEKFESVCPAGREMALVRTKLQEVVFWAQEAVAAGVRARKSS